MAEETVTRLSEVLKAVLEWSKSHPGSTLRDLEEQVQKAMGQVQSELMEAVVAEQGMGHLPEEGCACGGRWVFQGYRERQVMTTQGNIRVRRAYFTCDRCGAGVFPPGPAIEGGGGVERGSD